MSKFYKIQSVLLTYRLLFGSLFKRVLLSYSVQDNVINKSLMLTNYTSGLFPIAFCVNFFYRKSNLKSLKHILLT